jgi:hypothetical protein
MRAGPTKIPRPTHFSPAPLSRLPERPRHRRLLTAPRNRDDWAVACQDSLGDFLGRVVTLIVTRLRQIALEPRSFARRTQIDGNL